MRAPLACVTGLACVIGLAGCYDDKPGVLIEVQSPTPAQRFELLFSTAHCDTCTQIYPPSYSMVRAVAPVLGEGWETTDVARFHIELPEPSTTARFHIAADDDARVKRAVIVALAGEQMKEFETVVAVATIGGFDVSAGSSVKFEVPLHPADALDSPTNNQHVEFWRRKLDMDTHTACVVVQHADSAEFFVPADDPDCDNPVPVECDPYAYKASGLPPTLERANCVTEALGFCRIGGPQCAETGTSIAICEPVAPSYCLPSYVCNTPCAQDYTCDANATLFPGAMAYCETYTSAGKPCDNATVNSVRWELAELVVDHGGQCKSIQIAKPKLGEPVVFGDSISVVTENGTSTWAIDQATFVEDNCSIVVKWSGTFPVGTFAAVKLVTPLGVNRVVPWRLRPVSGQCLTPTTPAMTCNAASGNASDSFYACH